MASPFIAPKVMEVICTEGGMTMLIAVDKNGDAVDAGQHTLDCAMCMPMSLAAASNTLQAIQPQPLAYALNPIEAARIAALVGAPLPPRGPPSLS